jgi:CheY-like chemotaxis protein
MVATRHVLVVEDDEATRLLLQTILRRHGIATTMAPNGARGIELLEEQAFDLVILDLMMPHVGGVHVIEYLSTASRKPPVIVCTAAGPNATRDLSPEIVKAVLRKPFDIVELVERVVSLTGPGARPQSLPRLLIIDDDSDARFILRSFAEPAEVTEAEDGHAALRLVRELQPDAIFLDLNMPGMGGEEVLRQLRADEATVSIPVVIVTSQKFSQEDRDRLLLHGAGYIYKGDLSRERVRETLARLLNHPLPGAA